MPAPYLYNIYVRMYVLIPMGVLITASPASGKLGLRMTTLHEEPGRRNDDDSHSEPESAPTDDMTTPKSHVRRYYDFYFIVLNDMPQFCYSSKDLVRNSLRITTTAHYAPIRSLFSLFPPI